MIPTTPEELTPAWLTTALGREVDAVRAEDMGEGVGVLGTVVRLHLEGDDGLPATLVAKLPAPPGPNRDASVMYGFYTREVGFYRSVADGLPFGVPTCRYADMHETGMPFVLLLDEIDDVEAPDQIAGLEVSEIEVVVDAVAALHARYWDSPELDRLDWLPPMDNPLYLAFAEIGPSFLPAFEEGWADRLPPGTVDLARAVVADWVAIVARWVSDRPPTFVHYDLRGDNFLFGPGAGPTGFALLDYQMAVRHIGGHDLAYLLANNLDVDDRRRHEDDLLVRYHDRLRSAGVEVTVDEVRADYRSAALGLVAGTVQGAAFDPGNERGRALLDAMFLRQVTLAQDHDAGALLP